MGEEGMSKPVVVVPEREEAYDLMREACRRLGYDMDKPDRVIFRRLARDADVADVTFINLLERSGRPATRTLEALAKVTGVPIDTWLAAIGVTSSLKTAKQPLTPARRRLLRLVNGHNDIWINRFVDWLEGNPLLRENEDDTTHGSGPMPGGQTSSGYQVAHPQAVGMLSA